MNQNLLILGGTSQASDLASAVAAAGITATLSYAGRVARPRPQPANHRIGGFGGIDGLAAYLHEHGITHLIDATHPFAAEMSKNAVAASAATGIPLIALTRQPWQRQPEDNWQVVPDMTAAIEALARPAERILLAIGRMHLAGFAAAPQHHYVLRLVDPPEQSPPLPHHTIIVSRGPFTVASDTALMRDHAIDRIVAKNAGGSGAVAKIEAARALSIPVIMIDRPPLPARHETFTVAGVFDWLGHATTDLGV
jgi:precorrin-6A/cobalt-precorrin-6A reductase